MSLVIHERIKEAIQQNAVENRLSCTIARKIASDLSVPLKDVGQAANELRIKITDCELGCF
jgi:hypothetical protein